MSLEKYTASLLSFSQAKGTKSTSFVRNEVDLVPLACGSGLRTLGLRCVLTGIVKASNVILTDSSKYLDLTGGIQSGSGAQTVPLALLPLYCLSPTYMELCRWLRSHCLLLTLDAPIATKVVCLSRLMKCLRSFYGKQCGPRSDCSYRSSLFWVHAVCFYT